MPSSSHPEESLLQALLRIQLEWGLPPEKMASLLHVPPEEYATWIRRSQDPSDDFSRATIPPGMRTAVPLVAIQRHLARKLPQPEKQVEWLFTEHPDFSGAKPVDVISSSEENLMWVSYYLDSARDRGGSRD